MQDPEEPTDNDPWLRPPPGETNDIEMFCTRETFRTCHSDNVRWWTNWEEYYAVAEGVWSIGAVLPRWEWDEDAVQGFQFCGSFEGDQLAAMGAVWRYSDDKWEVAAVGTLPQFRCRGHAKAVVSLVTEHILDSGRTATCSTKPGNIAMFKAASAVGFCRIQTNASSPAEKKK